MDWIDWITTPIIIYVAIVPIGTAWSEAEKKPWWLMLLVVALAIGTAVVVGLGAVIGMISLVISLGFVVLLSGIIVGLLDWKNIKRPVPAWSPVRTYLIGIAAELVIFTYLMVRYAWVEKAVGSG